MWLFTISLLTLVGVPGVLFSAFSDDQDAPSLVFALFWIGIVGWFWYLALVWTSYEVVLSAEEQLSFKSVLKRTTMDARDVVFIGSAMDGWDPYMLVFRTDSGATARIPRQSDGLVALVTEIKKVNPRVELRGL